MLNWLLLSFPAFALAAAAAGDDTAATIIAMERAALNRSGDPDAFPDISDPDVTYFDPALERPIRGRDALRAYYHSLPPQPGGTGEMIDPKVQVAGDAAVLTFNYIYRPGGGAAPVHWNSTEVYRRTPHGWRIIHTHWSYLKPQLAKPQP